MDELKRILDDILLKSLDVRPEVQWLQKQHLLFMKKNGLTAKDCLYNIPDETRFVNIFFRANGIKWREIFGRQRYSENVR